MTKLRKGIKYFVQTTLIFLNFITFLSIYQYLHALNRYNDGSIVDFVGTSSDIITMIYFYLNSQLAITTLFFFSWKIILNKVLQNDEIIVDKENDIVIPLEYFYPSIT